MATARIYSDIDMDFSSNPVTQDIYKKTNVEAVKQALKNIMLTPFYSKPFAPNYGSPIAGLLFEPMDNITASAIANIIDETISNYEPRVRIDQVIVYPDFNNNLYKIQLDFHVLGVSAPQTFSTSLKRAR
jgi:phage baseplate assembly protein W|tara:strand:- start:132 stop:521 length:390 start_codon:yes stop_codon:yes gene_type:complete